MDTKTDPRLAPLAAALHKAGVNCMNPVALSRDVCLPTKRAGDFHNGNADDILAVLPDDWCGHDLGAYGRLGRKLATAQTARSDAEREVVRATATIATLRDELERSEAFEQAATIATLRAALDGLAKAAALPRNCGGGVTLKGEWIAVPKADFDALRAALAAAKEATDAG
jgi:hypothetical protein